jgi:hypothetical protein
MYDIVSSLHVVNNNSASTIGGGPNSDTTNRRAPQAPPFIGEATNTPVPPTATPPSGSIYGEDFNDGQAQSWTLANASVASQQLALNNWGGASSGIYDGQTFSANFTYAADVTTAAGSDGNKLRLVFNYTNASNYYYLEVGGGAANTITLNKKVGGAVTTLATYGSAYSIQNAWVRFEIVYSSGGYTTVKATKNGSTVTLFNNIQDTSLTAGKIGVEGLYMVATVDNVTVSGGAASTNTPVPPTATPTHTNTPIPPTTTRTNTPVPPTATSSGGTYSEDFNDGQAQSWTLVSAAVESQQLRVGNWESAQSAIYDGRTFSANYTYKVDVTTPASSTSNVLRILFNYTNSTNYYYVEIPGGASNSVKLKKVVNGSTSTLATYGAYSIKDVWATFEIQYASGGYITVKATKAGSTTTLFNNVRDTSLTSGKIGLQGAWMRMMADNVIVTY